MSLPSYKSWDQFGIVTFDQLQEEGSDANGSPWVQEAYQWFYKRLPGSKREQAQKPQEVSVSGPPSRLIPFPASIELEENPRTGFDRGCIAFVAVDSNGSREPDNTDNTNNRLKMYAFEAALFVYDLFRQLVPTVGYPNVEIIASTADGGSIALATMIAALCRILNISIPDSSMIATGCLKKTGREYSLTTVDSDTFDDKIIAAVRYGYRKMFVVHGQRNRHSQTPEEALNSLIDDKVLPADVQLKFIELPQDPLQALFAILQEMSDANQNSMAQLLAVFDKKYLRTNPHSTNDFVVCTVKPYCQSGSTLVRNVATDILRRHSLHLGKTLDAENYRKHTPPLSPRDFPSGWLGNYLKYEQAASLSVLDIDLGYWQDDAGEHGHSLSNRILARLKGNIDDHIADLEDVRVALAHANTKALRLRFRGRLESNANLIEMAWSELIVFQEYWDDIFAYTKDMGLQNETLARQRNQCLECLMDYKHLTGRLLEPFKNWGLSDFILSKSLAHPLNEPSASISDSFDLVAWLNERRLLDRSPSHSELEAYLDLADHYYSKYRGYPCFLPYEKILTYRIGPNAIQCHARDQLAKAVHLESLANFNNAFDPDIMTLLVIRSLCLLDRVDEAMSVCNHMNEIGNLKQIAVTLLKTPKQVQFRCPY